jgi:hypothetical protein
MAREVVVRPTGTSWGAVIDGWLATVGVAAILSPIVGLVLLNAFPAGGLAATAPILVAVGLSYLVGGYVAGRMAGYRTSWHGMMVAFFGVFVVLALLVVAVALDMGVFGMTGRLVQILPAVLGVALFESAETFAFGGALGILIAIFAAWLGGLLAPARMVVAPAPGTTAPVVGERTVTRTEVRPRRRFRLLPSAGLKGGERADEVQSVDRVEHVEGIEPR